MTTPEVLHSAGSQLENILSDERFIRYLQANAARFETLKEACYEREKASRAVKSYWRSSEGQSFQSLYRTVDESDVIIWHEIQFMDSYFRHYCGCNCNEAEQLRVSVVVYCEKIAKGRLDQEVLEARGAESPLIR